MALASRCGLALLALVGCRQVFGLSDPIAGDGGKPGDGVLNPDGSGGDFCLGPGGWSICLPTAPTNPVTLPTTTIDTEGVSLCLAAQPSSWSGAGQGRACIIVGSTITGTTVHATGNYPLVLF